MPVKFSQYEAQFRFRKLGEKLYFYNSSSNPFAFFAACPKDYDSPRCLCKRQIYDFPRVTGLLRIQARLHRPPCFVYLPHCYASRQPATSLEFKFVAIQVVDSVEIQAAKLRFAAESKTRVYFAQHVASTCITVFAARQVGHKRGNTRNNVFQHEI